MTDGRGAGSASSPSARCALVSEAQHLVGENAVEPTPTTLFPDLAVKPRRRRSRRPRDAEMAAMAYAARRHVELKREDDRSACHACGKAVRRSSRRAGACIAIPGSGH